MYPQGTQLMITQDIWDDGETPGVPRGFLAIKGDLVEVSEDWADGPIKVSKGDVEFLVSANAVEEP